MNLLKSFSIYSLIGFFGASVGLLVMPVLTHYLSPADYGIIALFNTYTGFLIPLVGFVASGYINVEYFNKENSPEEFRSIYSSILAIPIIPLIVFTVVIFLLCDFLGPLIEIPSRYIMLIPVLAVLSYYHQHILTFLATLKKPVIYGLSNISKVIFEVSLTLILIIGLKKNWEGRIESWLIALIAFLIFGIIFSVKNNLITFNLKSSHIRAGLAFGIPLIFHTIGKIVINQSDRVFISKMVSIDEMGVYNTGYLVGSIILILSSAFINVYNPFLYERLASINERKKIEIIRMAYLFIGALFLLLLIITFLTPYLYSYLIDESFSGGAKYVFWIGLSYWFWAGYLVFVGFIFYLKKTKILGYLAVLNVIMNLTFNYFFILNYGAIGAAYATVLSFFIIFILVLIISQRVYPMPWLNFKKILRSP